MLTTTMVAGPGPTFCDNGGRNVGEVQQNLINTSSTSTSSTSSPSGRPYTLSPTTSHFIPSNSIVTVTSSSTVSLVPAPSSSASSTSSPPPSGDNTSTYSSSTSISSIANSSTSSNVLVMTNGTSPCPPSSSTSSNIAPSNMVTVVPAEMCSPQYTPPPGMQQPTQVHPSYCSQEFIPGELYYPQEYSQQASLCTIHHGVPGPATVRMVSTNSSPPIPLPVQMPPGHVVQQIVDETGTLQHVILSPQPMHLPTVCSYGPNAGQGQFYSAPPGHHHPPPQGYMTSYQPQYSPVMSPPLASPPTHNYQKSEHHRNGSNGGRPPQDKGRNKFYQRPPVGPHHFQHPPPPPHGKNSLSHTPPPPVSPKTDASVIRKSSDEPTNGEIVESGPPTVTLQELLSQTKSPEISKLESFKASLFWTPPDLSLLGDQEVSPIFYEVFLNNNYYDKVSNTSIDLGNLRPGTEYKIHLICICNGVRGYATPTKIFCTKASIPDTPQPAKLFDRKKSSLSFKFTSPKDNGSRITSYSVDVLGGQWVAWTKIQNNRSKELSLYKLKPQTTYRIRLNATNEIGTSDYSKDSVATTLGVAPTQPNPPSLEQSSVTSLSLCWRQRPSDENFSLEMEHLDYGFRPVFYGPETKYTTKNLHRNQNFKFRMCAHNVNGKSPYSEIASYRTLPDKPQPPLAPSLKGKPSPENLCVTWSCPTDTGGTPVTAYQVQIDKGNGYESIYEGPGFECGASNLIPGKNYPLRVLAISSGGKSLWSNPGTLTTLPVEPGKCKPPKLLGKPKANTLQLKWGPVGFDGGSFVIEYQVDMMTPNSDRKQVYAGKDMECTVASLLPGRPYMFLLRAVNKIGPGGWSEPFEAVSGAGPPDAPKASNLACKGPHSVLVSWEQPINNGAGIQKYNVEMAEVTSPNVESSECSSISNEADLELTFSQVYSGSVSSAEIKNLIPATTFAFRVCACNIAGTGPFSPTSTVTTPAAAPATVGHISSTSEATEVTLHWTEPWCNGDPIIRYIINMGSTFINTEEPLLEFTLKNLQPETAYKIRMQAVNSVGVSPISSSHSVTTKALPPAPPKIEVIKASFNSLRLKWADGRNHDLLKYILLIELLNPQNNTMEFYQVYSGSNTSFKVGKLEENTIYRLKICASNEAGTGPYSDPVECTTTKAPPKPLKAPRVKEGPNGTYCIEWCGVHCPGEDWILYRLQMLQAGKDQDYSLIYTGRETSYIKSELEPETGYYVRVCGVRMSGDTEVIAGAYSSPILFNTPPRIETPQSQEEVKQVKVQNLSWSELTDNQKAMAILILFAFLAFIAAFFMSPDSVR